jgi:hypothetical protein
MYAQSNGFFVKLSDDFAVDAEKMVCQLNQYKDWFGKFGKWVVNNQRDECEFPFFWKYDDGVQSNKLFPSTIIDVPNESRTESNTSLKEISEKISIHIRKGYMEIFYMTNHYESCLQLGNFLTTERKNIKIHSNRSVQLTKLESHIMDSTFTTEVTSYSPSKTSI